MNIIVVVDKNWGIGKDGDQLCYISADLKRFKALTTGHPLILGRKTLLTFPGGRPLKGRRNLILSRNPEYKVEGAEIYPDMDALLKNATKDACVIGGASVYNALLDHCEIAYVTKIRGEYPADCYFPNLDTHAQWEIIETSEEMEENGVFFSYVTYRYHK